MFVQIFFSRGPLPSSQWKRQKRKKKSGEMYSSYIVNGWEIWSLLIQVNKVINNKWLFTRGHMDNDTQKECLEIAFAFHECH